jgi:hypothetical protein
MTKQATESGPQSPGGGRTERWPKIVAAPAVWESGAAASRLGRMPRSLYRPRRLAVDPAQRATLW